MCYACKIHYCVGAQSNYVKPLSVELTAEKKQHANKSWDGEKMREGARERITANHINITYIVEYVAVVVLFVFRSYKLNRFSLLLLLPLLYPQFQFWARTRTKVLLTKLFYESVKEIHKQIAYQSLRIIDFIYCYEIISISIKKKLIMETNLFHMLT